MKRQGLNVRPADLRKLADDLEKEIRQLEKNIRVKIKYPENIIFLVPIINKTKQSDMWQFENQQF